MFSLSVDYEPSLKRIKLEKGVPLEGEEEEDEEGHHEVALSTEMNIKLEGPTEEDIGAEQVPIEYVGEEVNEYVNEDPNQYVNEDPNQYVTEEANEYVIVNQEFAVAEDEVS